MGLAGYQTSSSVESIDKNQISECVGESMSVFENFYKTKLSKMDSKYRPDLVDLITFLFQ